MGNPVLNYMQKLGHRSRVSSGDYTREQLGKLYEKQAQQFERDEAEAQATAMRAQWWEGLSYAKALADRGEDARAREVALPLFSSMDRFNVAPLPGNVTGARIAELMSAAPADRFGAELADLMRIGQTRGFIPEGAKTKSAQFGETGRVVQLEDGSYARSIPIMDPNTQTIENRLVPIEGTPVNNLGLTPEGMVDYAGDKARASEQGKGEARRGQEVIDVGLRAAQQMPVLKRTQDLLGELETGGFAGAGLRIKNALGIEGADEAELTTNMARSVLSQLRDTFGAQFTEREGARLERIEAGIGKSTEGNKRIVKNLLQMAEFKAGRAIEAAKRNGDYFTVEEIDSYMNMQLNPQAPAAPAAPAVGTGQIKFLGFEE